ncbi:MAG TPA: hypothetical protein VEV17_04075 [Bryobacteraceae bacterium]|nr:hypothetical protein [Bryobacteraceae bacterium]
MAQETFDYSAMLADARAKRDALDAFIASLETAQALGALGQPSAGGVVPGGYAAPGKAIELPVGALRNKSVSNAIRLYLEACRKNQTTREITEGLQEGGVVSTSKNFGIIVYNTLRLLKKAGVVLLFKDGWGLAEHVPEAIRTRLAQQEGVSKKVARKGRGPNRKPKSSQAKRKKEAANTPPASRPDVKFQEMPKAS